MVVSSSNLSSYVYTWEQIELREGEEYMAGVGIAILSAIVSCCYGKTYILIGSTEVNHS